MSFVLFESRAAARRARALGVLLLLLSGGLFWLAVHVSTGGWRMLAGAALGLLGVVLLLVGLVTLVMAFSARPAR